MCKAPVKSSPPTPSAKALKGKTYHPENPSSILFLLLPTSYWWHQKGNRTNVSSMCWKNITLHVGTSSPWSKKSTISKSIFLFNIKICECILTCGAGNRKWPSWYYVHLTAIFPGGPGLADTRMSLFWILLELRVTEVVVTTGAIRHAKLQSNRHHEQTNTKLFTGWMHFLSPDQECQHSEGKWYFKVYCCKITTKHCRQTIAVISPSAWRYSTILLLWVGSTRAKRRARRTAAACSARLRSSNSRPVYDRPAVLSFSSNTPIRRQIASAVACDIRKTNQLNILNFLQSMPELGSLVT